MNLATFRQTWQAINSENRFHRFFTIALILINFLTLWALLQASRTVVLVPPILEQQVSVAREQASQPVKEAWGVFVAELLGNITERNATFMNKTLEPLLSPELRGIVAQRIDQELEKLLRDQVTTRFSTERVLFDKATDSVLVEGSQRHFGPAAAPVDRRRIFEVRVEFRNYRPFITDLNAYGSLDERNSALKEGN
jgi:conjugal transfer pilus assembly protein TraE